MPSDVGSKQAERRRRYETTEAEQHSGEERLSHSPTIMSPSPFVMESLGRYAPPRGDSRMLTRVFDVAMGRGRHALPIARNGYCVYGVDVNPEALQDAALVAQREGVHLRVWCADLTQHPLPRAYFDVVLVTRYLQRDLFPAIRDAVVPGGIVIYETFTVKQLALGVGPKSPDHLLEPGELRRHFDDFEVLFYEEVERPEAVARLVARKNHHRATEAQR
jgi:tellurite methyltransferase